MEYEIPKILSANTFYWNSGKNSSTRRWNEEKNQSEVANFLEKIGFDVNREGDHVIGKRDGVEINFHYTESCNNVYKTLKIYKNDKRSNITLLKKIASVGAGYWRKKKIEMILKNVA